jgi:hypothetical protein
MPMPLSAAALSVRLRRDFFSSATSPRTLVEACAGATRAKAERIATPAAPAVTCPPNCLEVELPKPLAAPVAEGTPKPGLVVLELPELVPEVMAHGTSSHTNCIAGQTQFRAWTSTWCRSRCRARSSVGGGARGVGLGTALGLRFGVSLDDILGVALGAVLVWYIGIALGAAFDAVSGVVFKAPLGVVLGTALGAVGGPFDTIFALDCRQVFGGRIQHAVLLARRCTPRISQ